MKFILGKKIGMTQIFTPSGEVVPVTKVQAGPCQIVQIKDIPKNKVKSIQIGFGEKRKDLLKKPQLGHLKGLKLSRSLQDFSVDSLDNLKRGDNITVETFEVGEKVAVTGTSKGKGFAGVVKRHHFKGGPASHGHKDNLRAPGSIGAGGIQRVFKGTRMAGHMGSAQVTVKNLEIIKIDLENNELYLRGAIPGCRNGIISIKALGDLKIASLEKIAPVEEKKEEVEKVDDVKVDDVKKEEVKVKEVESEEKKEEVKEETKS